MTFHYIKELIEKSGMDTPLTAVNDLGEDVIIEYGGIDEECGEFFRITAIQSNDWLRINEYYKDGTVTETYKKNRQISCPISYTGILPSFVPLKLCTTYH